MHLSIYQSINLSISIYIYIHMYIYIYIYMYIYMYIYINVNVYVYCVCAELQLRADFSKMLALWGEVPAPALARSAHNLSRIYCWGSSLRSRARLRAAAARSSKVLATDLSGRSRTPVVGLGIEGVVASSSFPSSHSSAYAAPLSSAASTRFACLDERRGFAPPLRRARR